MINKDFKVNLDKYFENANGKSRAFYLKKLKENAKKIKNNYLLKNKSYFILKNVVPNKEKNIEKKILFISKLFGRLRAQNKEGKYLVEVTPNIKKIKKLRKKKIGALKNLRYHQTNSGGSVHTDGPQLSSPPSFILMYVKNSANTGGKTIIVNPEKIYYDLKKNHPNEFKILKKKFHFERRGFYRSKKKSTLNGKIFLKKNDKFQFRYLREYIDKAYDLKNITLSLSQKKALNLLDSKLLSKKFQKLYKLNSRDFIILNNKKIAHGRTSFKLSGEFKRSLCRVWIN